MDRHVYIVLISTKSLNAPTRVGAVYPTFSAALKEVERLQASNEHTTAWWVCRQLVEEPK